MSEKRLIKYIEGAGDYMVELFHLIGLFVIGITVIWSAVYAYLGMLQQGHADLKDILLLFIYLELGAMVGIYFKTHHLPVRFLIYIAITALTRILTVDIKEMSNETVMVYTGAILLLTIAVLILRFCSARLRREEDEI